MRNFTSLIRLSFGPRQARLPLAKLGFLQKPQQILLEGALAELKIQLASLTTYNFSRIAAYFVEDRGRQVMTENLSMERCYAF